MPNKFWPLNKNPKTAFTRYIFTLSMLLLDLEDELYVINWPTKYFAEREYNFIKIFVFALSSLPLGKLSGESLKFFLNMIQYVLLFMQFQVFL